MHTIALRIPESLGFQLIYRQERADLFAMEERKGLEFIFLSWPGAALRHLARLQRCLGWSGTFKTLAKLATRRRFLYLVLERGQVVSTGWCTVGRCRFYKVEPDAVVIGPIWSAEDARGRGLATYSLKKALDRLAARGHRVFYIDTFKDNYASQRVIEKTGFGAPVALFVR
jgi:GNAT superfamily N-acetyltransferase